MIYCVNIPLYFFFLSRIGVTEKGYATLELMATTQPGHSSMPPKETAIGILAKAVAALENNPHDSMFGRGPEVDFFSYLAPTVRWICSVCLTGFDSLPSTSGLLGSKSPFLESVAVRTPVTHNFVLVLHHRRNPEDYYCGNHHPGRL